MSDEPPEIFRGVELFENERYTPLTGWSSKGLLLTDRKAFTTADGQSGWSSLEEASEYYLSCGTLIHCDLSHLSYLHFIGWRWYSSPSHGSESILWKVDVFLENCDDDGWAYATDFNSFTDHNSGTRIKSMVHFVRRRRYLRKQYFDGK